MYNPKIMKEIELVNKKFAQFKDPNQYQQELEKIIAKYEAKTEIIKTLPNGINLYRVLDKNGFTIAEYHGIEPVKQWGGSRPGAGRKPTGRKKQTFYITDKENELLRKYLEELRNPAK